MSNPRDTDTAELVVPASPPTLTRPAPYSSLVLVDVGALSHTGKVRRANEDHYLVTRTGRFLDTLLTNLPEGALPARFDETGYGLLVADGMGGQAGGAVASRLAIVTLVNIVLNIPDWIMKPDDALAQEMQRRAAEAYRRVGAALNAEGQRDPDLFGMGTTMTLAYSLGTDLFLTHIGDSRAYLFRGGRLYQLTRDQTLAQALAEQGAIRPDEVATHRMRHVLLGVLGGNTTTAPVEVKRVTLADGDRLLLCSDGLTEMVEDAAIAEILVRTEPSQDACQALVDRALERGGKDNVTVVLARYRMPPGSSSG